jgi:hypothetical protein
MTLIARDPFAREELHRRTVRTDRTCRCCGARRPSGRLYEYRTETDGGRTHPHPGLFCSVGCFRAYHRR